MTKHKLFITLLVAMLSLTACVQGNRYESVHADEIIAQQEAKRNENPYENMGAYDNVFTVVKEELLEDYAIKGVDFPDVPDGFTLQSDDTRDLWKNHFIVRILTLQK